MLKNELAGQDTQDKYAMDEWLFDIAARSKARADVPMADDSRAIALHPLAAAWEKPQKNQRRETVETLNDQQLHQQRISTLGLLACGLAHDMNNMLTIVINNAAIGMLDADRGGPGQETMKEILRAAENAKNLTNRILKFGGSQAFEKCPTDINALINDMLGMMKTIIPKNVLKRVILDSELPSVNAAPEQLIQALMNLITNAIDAMPDGGVLTISTRCAATSRDMQNCDADSSGRDTCCQIQIADTGCGIPEHHQDDVFQPFFTTKQPGKGTGLGLPIATSIIEKHGGKISMRSDRNQGTSVHISIPFA